MVSDGVLLMAYGTPATLQDVETYYTHIRRGRRPEPEQLAELLARYEAIGGSSPLLEITSAQAQGLERRLAELAGKSVRVELGMKHAPPFIEDGVQALRSSGIRRATGLVLAPHYSALSVGEYRERALHAAGEDLDLSFVEHWHLAPGYVELLASRVADCLGQFPPEERAGVAVVFTAHSLPERIVAAGDPYPQQLLETAEAVALRAGLDRWSTAWQSAGRTGEKWLGPDVVQVARELAASGASGMIVCPAGFVSDHLEILYDLDVECHEVAHELGLPFRRTESPNADPAFVSTLADVVLGNEATP
jgi:ferrochelatase